MDRLIGKSRCRALRGGFPAHAGMDPDGSSVRAHPLHAVSPPTRGWTLTSSAADRQAVDMVSPPTRGWTLWRARFLRADDRRFPRPRGDGPDIIFWIASVNLVYPPTRGWTAYSPPTHPCLSGFPRPRGDGPHEDRDHWSGRCAGFPRPRGDGPDFDESFYVLLGCRGFPAHAGMDRGVGLAYALPITMVSPPTRGWTHRQAFSQGMT